MSQRKVKYGRELTNQLTAFFFHHYNEIKCHLEVIKSRTFLSNQMSNREIDKLKWKLYEYETLIEKINRSNLNSLHSKINEFARTDRICSYENDNQIKLRERAFRSILNGDKFIIYIPFEELNETSKRALIQDNIFGLFVQLEFNGYTDEDEPIEYFRSVFTSHVGLTNDLYRVERSELLENLVFIRKNVLAKYYEASRESLEMRHSQFDCNRLMLARKLYPNLKHLYLSETIFDDEELLFDFVRLETLDLTNCTISSVNFVNMFNLRHLFIENIDLIDDLNHDDRLIECMARLETLQVNTRWFKRLFEWNRNEHLKQLRINDSQDDLIRSLAEISFFNFPNLASFELCNSKRLTIIGRNDLRDVSANLSRFVLRNCPNLVKIHAKSFKHIGGALKELTLVHTNIGEQQQEKKKLSVYRMRFAKSHGVLKFLRPLRSLDKLDLIDCNLRSVDTTSIAKMISHLKEFDFGLNKRIKEKTKWSILNKLGLNAAKLVRFVNDRKHDCLSIRYRSLQN